MLEMYVYSLPTVPQSTDCVPQTVIKGVQADLMDAMNAGFNTVTDRMTSEISAQAVCLSCLALAFQILIHVCRR